MINKPYRNEDELKDHLHSDVNESKQQYWKRSIFIPSSTTGLKVKPSFPISKQLTSYRTKSQAKMTILGTDRATFTYAVTMALKQYVSEIVIYDPYFNQQMKTCFHDVSEPYYSV